MNLSKYIACIYEGLENKQLWICSLKTIAWFSLMMIFLTVRFSVAEKTTQKAQSKKSFLYYCTLGEKKLSLRTKQWYLIKLVLLHHCYFQETISWYLYFFLVNVYHFLCNPMFHSNYLLQQNLILIRI